MIFETLLPPATKLHQYGVSNCMPCGLACCACAAGSVVGVLAGAQQFRGGILLLMDSKYELKRELNK